MKTYIIRIKSLVDNKTYVLRIKQRNKYMAVLEADRVFVSKHKDKLPATFAN